MKRESFHGRYWLCQSCHEFVPDELDVCECGNLRYSLHRTSVSPNIHVSKIPPGLRGDKMYVYRQDGKQVMDKMMKKQGEEIRKRTKERLRSSRPVVISNG